MITIWKFSIPDRKNTISIPQAFRILSVGVQDDIGQLWAVVDTEAEMCEREIFCYCTGDELPNEGRVNFIGTFVGIEKMVVHVFENVTVPLDIAH